MNKQTSGFDHKKFLFVNKICSDFLMLCVQGLNELSILPARNVSRFPSIENTQIENAFTLSECMW